MCRIHLDADYALGSPLSDKLWASGLWARNIVMTIQPWVIVKPESQRNMCHPPSHTPSPHSLFSFLTVCNNMKQHASQLFSFQIQRTRSPQSEPRARIVRGMPLCQDSYLVCKAYFFWGSVHKPLNLSWSVIRGNGTLYVKKQNGTEHLVKAHLRELHWIGPIVFKMQLEQHAFYITLH